MKWSYYYQNCLQFDHLLLHQGSSLSSAVFSVLFVFQGKKIPTTKLTLMKPWSRGQAQANESWLIIGGYMGQMAQLNTVFCEYPESQVTLVSTP